MLLIFKGTASMRQFFQTPQHILIEQNTKSRFYAPGPVVDAQTGLQLYCLYVQKLFLSRAVPVSCELL